MSAEVTLRPELSGAALPVEPTRLDEYYREVESFQRERARGARRSARLAWSLAGISLLTNVALGFAVASMLPLERLVPVYLWVRHDGTVDSASEISDLPATQAVAVIRAAVWQYVRDRESYAYADARYRYDVVSLMSAPDVRDTYQRWFLSANPASPQNTIGRRGQIDAAMIGMSFVRPRVALVRYAKTVLMYGGTTQKTTWTATVGFARVDKLPAADRLSDPGGIVVTSYQNSEDSPQ
jgi:type IV secretion system protein VirB8